MNNLTYNHTDSNKESLVKSKPDIIELAKYLAFCVNEKNINGKRIEFFSQSMFEHICNYYDELPEDITAEQIVEFCDVHYFGACFCPVELRWTFMYDWKVWFLWAYASEISYMIQRLWIPFIKIRELDLHTRWMVCGILRRAITPDKDFDIYSKPADVDPRIAFDLNNLFRNWLLFEWSDLMKFVYFVRENSTVIPLPESKIKYIESNISSEWPNEKIIKRYKIWKIKQKIKYQKKEFKNSSAKDLENILIKLSSSNSDTGQWLQLIKHQSKSLMAKNLWIDFYLKTQYKIRQNRLEDTYKWLLTIWAKIHVSETVDEKKVQEFNDKFWFVNSWFKLIHSNTSLLLPHSQYAEDLIYMIVKISEENYFSEDPQLHICIPWRMPNTLCGILCSSLLLLSEQHVEYLYESFDSTHNSETGRMMVAYDAGVYDANWCKYNPESITWRTDVLLLKDINLIPKAQIIWSLLSQSVYGWLFEELWKEFIIDYSLLLRKYDMAKYIYDYHRVMDDEAKAMDDDYRISQHLEAVTAFTNKQLNDIYTFAENWSQDWLLIFELNNLLQKYTKKIKDIQNTKTL